MGSIILIIIIVILAVQGDYTSLYIFAGIFALAGIAEMISGGKRNTGKKEPLERPRTKIHHPRYYEDDEYECGICGTRFSRDANACPHCGVHFNQTETNWEAFDDEEELDDILFEDD